jgi:hypothetical protein
MREDAIAALLFFGKQLSFDSLNLLDALNV